MKAKDLQSPKKEGAGCLIFCRETDKFLLIERSEYVPSPLTWALPGGGVDPGESPEEAARREILEEINVNINDTPLILIYTNEEHSPRFKFYTFACTVKQEFEPTMNYEISNYKWCDLSDLPEPLHWGLKQMFAHDKSAKILKKFIEEQKSLHRSSY